MDVTDLLRYDVITSTTDSDSVIHLHALSVERASKMKKNCYDPSSDDDMLHPRQVGVRRTQRKKIIISMVILAFVIGFWQLFGEDDGIIRVGEIHEHHDINNLRVAVVAGNVNYFPGGAYQGNYLHQTLNRNLTKATAATEPWERNKSRDDSDEGTVPFVLNRGNRTGITVISTGVGVDSRPNITRSQSLTERLIHLSPDSGESEISQQKNLTVVNTTEPKPGEIWAKYDTRNETGRTTTRELTNYGANLTSNYTHPRYSTTDEGQFKFLKFINVSALPPSPRAERLSSSPFNEADSGRLALLVEGQLREVYSIQHHEHLRLVAFDTPTALRETVPIESCPTCATIKKTKDINEVLAFHVDRTLGVGRALPVSARMFGRMELENLLFDQDRVNDTFPVMWFARDLIHEGRFQPDQNSVQLNWRQYQEILSNCQPTKLAPNVTNCTGINYSDWSRMAVLDFVMQNYDRLDRYCCGIFAGRLPESCYEARGEIYDCDDIDGRFLVHILTSKSDPSQLVLLDNAGDISVGEGQLNYEILAGIRTIPRQILLNVNSEDFGERLKSSLQWDPVYAERMGEAELQRQVDTITRRVEKLRLYIKERNITQLEAGEDGPYLR